VCVFVCVCLCVCVCVCMCVFVRLLIDTHNLRRASSINLKKNTYTRIHISMYTCIFSIYTQYLCHVYRHMNIYLHICQHIYIHTHIYICKYRNTYIFTHTPFVEELFRMYKYKNIQICKHTNIQMHIQPITPAVTFSKAESNVRGQEPFVGRLYIYIYKYL